ncbi:hypothetical protein AAVH_39955, partial [Aphelenchoides avenae]
GAYIGHYTFWTVWNGGELWKTHVVVWVGTARTWVSMVFLLYWQLHGDLERIYSLLIDHNLYSNDSQNTLRRIDTYVAMVVILHAVVDFGTNWWSMTALLLGNKEIANLTFPD